MELEYMGYIKIKIYTKRTGVHGIHKNQNLQKELEYMGCIKIKIYKKNWSTWDT